MEEIGDLVEMSAVTGLVEDIFAYQLMYYNLRGGRFTF